MPDLESNLAPGRPGPDVLRNYKTVHEAARILHVSERRVYHFLKPGPGQEVPRLAGLKMGRQWLIPIDALAIFRRKKRRVGRPRKGHPPRAA